MNRETCTLLAVVTVATLTIGPRLEAHQALCRTYDASITGLPTDPDWESRGTGQSFAANGPDAFVLTTLPTASVTECSGPADPNTFYYEIPDPDFDFDRSIVFEVEVLIETSERTSNPCTTWPRAGFTIELCDAWGRNVHVGLGESAVYLMNSPYVPFGDPGAEEWIMDTTDTFHVYRLLVDGAGAVLYIDGVARLSLPHGPPSGRPGRIAMGDQTIWANCRAQVSRMSVFTGVAAPGWANLGHALAGGQHVPCLASDGEPVPGNLVELVLDSLDTTNLSYWVQGTSAINAPFKGGIMVPNAGEVLTVAVSPPESLSFNIPPGLSSGLTIYWQVWIPNAMGPFGWASSNAISVTVP